MTKYEQMYYETIIKYLPKIAKELEQIRKTLEGNKEDEEE